jgi:hypothetical protein
MVGRLPPDWLTTGYPDGLLRQLCCHTGYADDIAREIEVTLVLSVCELPHT